MGCSELEHGPELLSTLARLPLESYKETQHPDIPKLSLPHADQDRHVRAGESFVSHTLNGGAVEFQVAIGSASLAAVNVESAHANMLGAADSPCDLCMLARQACSKVRPARQHWLQTCPRPPRQ